jgi:hypothetical protein
MANNPWVQIIGGTTEFRMLAVGESFRFPHAEETYRKVSTRSYLTNQGRRHQTGARAAVVRLTNKEEG